MPLSDADARRAYNAAHRRANPEAYRRYNREKQLKRKYGLTLDQWTGMVAAVGGKCEHCSRVVFADYKRHGVSITHCAVPDHCHETGRIRGVLCHTCNKALGMLGDTEESIQRLLEYIRRG